jgi:hypothetical protein
MFPIKKNLSKKFLINDCHEWDVNQKHESITYSQSNTLTTGPTEMR